MDLMSIIGLILAFVALIVGSILKGAGLAGLLGGAAAMIVLVGTAAAIMIQTPGHVLKRAMAITPWLFKPPSQDPGALLDKISEWSRIARKDGLLGLEEMLEKEDDEFTRKGLQMLVDGGEPDSIRSILEIEMDSNEAFDTAAAKVYEGMGIYAPTLGIVGAVLGLMAVMGNLADPSKLGPGIAAAFTATIYGIGSANLFFLPFANKLKQIIKDQMQYREALVAGFVAIAQGENPREIESRLRGYFVGDIVTQGGEAGGQES